MKLVYSTFARLKSLDGTFTVRAFDYGAKTDPDTVSVFESKIDQSAVYTGIMTPTPVYGADYAWKKSAGNPEYKFD